MDKIFDTLFQDTTSLLFGKRLSPLGRYSSWLEKHLLPSTFVETAIDKKKLYTVKDFFFMKGVPENRIISEEEVKKIKSPGFNPEKLNSLKDLRNALSQTSYYNIEYIEGKNENTSNVIFYRNLINGRNICSSIESKNSAFCRFIWQSESVFGSWRLFGCKFCVNCYNSTKLSMCFECDSCQSCSSSMFCHNCENLHDSLFCSNTKNLRHAVFNKEIGKE